MAVQRLVEREHPAIVPVVFPDFDLAKDKDPGQGGLLWVPRVGAGVQHIYTTGGHVDEQVDGRGAPRVRKPPC